MASLSDHVRSFTSIFSSAFIIRFMAALTCSSPRVLSAERRVMLKATLFCPAAICLPWYTSNSLMDSRIWPQAD